MGLGQKEAVCMYSELVESVEYMSRYAISQQRGPVVSGSKPLYYGTLSGVALWMICVAGVLPLAPAAKPLSPPSTLQNTTTSM